MAEKRRRSCQDSQDALAESNRSGDISLAAVTQSGSGPEGRPARSCLGFFCNRLSSITAWSMVLGPISRACRETSCAGRTGSSYEKSRFWNGYSYRPVQEVAAYTWCTECDHLRSGFCIEERRARWLTLAGRRGTGVQARSVAPVPPGQLQRLGTRTTGGTPGRVFALGLTPSARAHQGPLVLAWKSSH